ncbi:phosphoribosylformylglycinamidine cyclo-ligase [Gammaproteobacteria bacterium]|nr:phosphoribosylformylglycinamidine cyclo-ligase [Gammaproteobacteria bacterium]MDB2357295.1 phosphoribosylformylglycinamidine cyclo-ligase [Gammaproteobacteria bacterium]
MTSKTKPTDPYAKAGVNIKKGNELVESIKASVNATHDPRVLGGIGGFAGLFQLGSKYKNPVLVGCTDGVGTKVALSQAHNKTHLIGQDLVAMCVNDMITCGAEPLFFLDYFAASKLEPKVTAKIVKGIANACKKSNCALLGGETAEMPGHYIKDNFDLAGFSIGVVEKKSLINGKDIKPGHILLGIESSGPHSNGYSLIRSILKKHKAPDSIIRVLLKPTLLYTSPVLELIKKTNVKGMAHITGGGLTENIPRILKKGLVAKIALSTWNFPKAFQWLQAKGKISQSDMLRIFNCGIGMVCVLDKADVPKAQKILSAHKLRSYEIGCITTGDLKEQIHYKKS